MRAVIEVSIDGGHSWNANDFMAARTFDVASEDDSTAIEEAFDEIFRLMNVNVGDAFRVVMVED